MNMQHKQYNKYNYIIIIYKAVVQGRNAVGYYTSVSIMTATQ